MSRADVSPSNWSNGSGWRGLKIKPGRRANADRANRPAKEIVKNPKQVRLEVDHSKTGAFPQSKPLSVDDRQRAVAPQQYNLPFGGIAGEAIDAHFAFIRFCQIIDINKAALRVAAGKTKNLQSRLRVLEAVYLAACVSGVLDQGKCPGPLPLAGPTGVQAEGLNGAKGLFHLSFALLATDAPVEKYLCLLLRKGDIGSLVICDMLALAELVLDANGIEVPGRGRDRSALSPRQRRALEFRTAYLTAVLGQAQASAGQGRAVS